MILITGSELRIYHLGPAFLSWPTTSPGGVAVLRVDDRGVGGSTGSVRSSTSEDFAGDVLAGVGFLKGRKEINPKKIGLIGHSEGGIIAPMAAARSKDVAFIVLMAGTGLPGTEVLVAQAQLILKANGASESQMKIERDAQKRLMDILAQEKDEKVAEARLAAALKDILASMPESERKASARPAAALGRGQPVQQRLFRPSSPDPRPTFRTVRCPVLRSTGRRTCKALEGKPRGDDKALKW